jgi:phage/plasmid-like protein (TIGR03299 family)
MAHEVEQMMYVGEAPWHGLGVDMTKTPPKTSEEAIKAAGLDWNVERRELFAPSRVLLNAEDKTQVKGAARAIKVPDSYAMVRSTDERVLGVVGPNYTPLQNREAFEFLDPILEAKDATWETAGSLRGGRVVWGLLKMAKSFEVLPGDKVSSYMLVTSSHDGSKVVQVRFSAVRVVCMNTLSAALASKSDRDAAIKIRHTATVASRTKQAVDVLTELYRSATQAEEICKTLAAKALKPQTVSEFVASLFEGEDGKLSARAENTVSAVLDLVANGKGSNIRGVRGTAWGVLNGITEYTTHQQGIPAQSLRSRKVTVSKAESHLESVWFGTGKELADRALEGLLAI